MKHSLTPTSASPRRLAQGDQVRVAHKRVNFPSGHFTQRICHKSTKSKAPSPPHFKTRSNLQRSVTRHFPQSRFSHAPPLVGVPPGGCIQQASRSDNVQMRLAGARLAHLLLQWENRGISLLQLIHISVAEVTILISG